MTVFRKLEMLLSLFLGSCAALTDLSSLEPRDAATLGDATDDGADVGTLDAPIVDGSVAYCLGLAVSSYSFCADFDESDVTLGYQNGVPAHWTTVSKPPPTLTMTSLSPPEAGQFVGGTNSSLSFTNPSPLASVAFDGWVQVRSPSPTTNVVAAFFMSPAYAVTVLTIESGSTYQMMVNEVVVNPDGGTSPTSHALAALLTKNQWYELVASVSPTTVTVSIGTNKLTFARTSLTTSQPSTWIGGSGGNWVTYWDNVQIKAS